MMSGYDCLNKKRFSGRRKVDSELAATTSVGSVYSRCVEPQTVMCPPVRCRLLFFTCLRELPTRPNSGNGGSHQRVPASRNTSSSRQSADDSERLLLATWWILLHVGRPPARALNVGVQMKGVRDDVHETAVKRCQLYSSAASPSLASAAASDGQELTLK